MAPSAEDLQWLGKAVHDYAAEHSAELIKADNMRGSLSEAVLALQDWADDSDDVGRAYDRSKFVLDRHMSGESLRAEDLTAAWTERSSGGHAPE